MIKEIPDKIFFEKTREVKNFPGQNNYLFPDLD